MHGRSRDSKRTIDPQPQSAPFAVVRPVFVPHDRQHVSVVADVVGGAVLQGAREEGVDLHRVVRSSAQSKQSREDQVNEGGVVVVVAHVAIAVVFEVQSEPVDPVAQVRVHELEDMSGANGVRRVVGGGGAGVLLGVLQE